MEEKTPWQSYVGMNKGYNMIFDSWQEISDIITPEANKAVNMALRILDEALDSVKATVSSVKNESPKLEVVRIEESEKTGKDEKKSSGEKRSFGGFKIFGGKK